MPAETGGSGTEWTLTQLTELFGDLEELGSSAGKARLLDRLVTMLSADAAVCLLDQEPIATGLGDAARDAVVGALVAWAGDETGTVHVEAARPLHVVVVPLDSGPGERLAVLRTTGEFGRAERSLARSVGRMLELSLSSSRSIEKLRERNALLEVLRTAERSMSARSSLAETLQTITDGARQLLGRVVSGIVLSRDGRLEVVAGSPRREPSPITFPYPVVHPEQLQRLMEGADVVAIDDYRDIPNPNPSIVALGVRRVLIAPIRPGPDPLGCILVGSTDAACRFSADQIEALRSLADHAAIAISDARAREEVEATLDELGRRAVTDDLTNLLNRRGLFAAIEEQLATRAHDAPPMCALFIDLDRFKFVNDVHGHHVADRVLVEAARRLHDVVGDGIVGRLAGDEFVVLLHADLITSEDRAGNIGHALEQPFEIDGVLVHVGASVGVALFNGHRSASELLMDADLAMMEAKQQGRGRTVRYGAGLRANLDHRSGLELSIRDALHEHRFDIHLQPIVEMASGRVTGAEALLRWPDLNGSHVRPGSVLSVAADAGLLPMLDMAIVRTALTRLVGIRERIGRPNFRISVNLTPATASLPDLSDRILDELCCLGLSPSSLALELVETPVMDSDVTIANLEELDRAGVSITLDNFGAGWSSLHRLRRVPLTHLKIDRGFVAGVGTDEAAEAIIQGLLRLAPAVGVEVIAEGVETAEQAAWLREHGCAYGQGFQFGRPSSIDEFVASFPVRGAAMSERATLG